MTTVSLRDEVGSTSALMTWEDGAVDINAGRPQVVHTVNGVLLPFRLP
ncbi:MAG: hypothetical protein ACRC35_10555 [Angustibacter sp.]